MIIMRNLLGIIFLISYVAIQGSAYGNSVHKVNRRLYLSDLQKDRQSGNVFFQGDILLNSQDVNKIQHGGQLTPTRKWPYGIIPYAFSGDFSYEDKMIIGRAMLEIQSKTCIRFVARTTQYDYVYINKMDKRGCFSAVGLNGGWQTINLGDDCITHGIILHELMHTIGFWHEQSRHDRDDYITIDWTQIDPQLQDNFKKVTGYSNDFGLPYDFNSVTHYGREQGITPVIGEVAIGQRDLLSELDELGIKWMYNCPLVQPPPPNCGDVDPYFCPKLVSHYGWCQVDMKKGCRSSCNTCASASCHDKGDNCDFFLERGICFKDQDFASRICAKTCNFCH